MGNVMAPNDGRNTKSFSAFVKSRCKDHRSSWECCCRSNKKDSDFINKARVQSGVELRGVEPLSESSLTRPSPSAVCGSDFPHAYAHRQEWACGSFMLRTHGKA